jgi:hypothetical protein
MPRTTSKKPAAGQGNNRDNALALMLRPQGATLAEMTRATRWQPHSARAEISRLRKAGHAITRTKRDSGESCYMLAEQG